ncbi:MAG: hypothetical protein BGO41_07785 [Clostridiales bacterium 38-18]|nr:MAG: hypothetical protein BGO41_07785 [Clostridiales bacterium 38-18]
MKKYIDFIYRFQKPLMLLFVIINITAIYGIFQLNIQTNFDIFKIENSQYQENMNLLVDQFSTSDQMIIMISNYGQAADKVTHFEDKLEAIDSIKYVKRVEATNGLPDIEALKTTKQVDGVTYGIITVFPDESFRFADLKDIENLLKDGDFDYAISGNQYMQNKIFDYLLYILLLIPPSALFILFNIFRLQMRSAKATLLSIMPAGIAALWTLGFAGLIGNEISILTVLAPIFTIIIGSADGLHFISHVQEHLESGDDMRASLTKTLKMVGMPMVITTVTSVAGFISLLFMQTKAIYDLAIFASIGITLAGIATWFIIPLINSFEKLNIHKKKNTKGIEIDLKKLWGRPALIFTAVVIIVSAYFIPKIQTEFNQLMMYKSSTEVSKSFTRIMDVNEGTIPIFALVPYSGNPLSSETTDLVNRFSTAMKAEANVTKIISINEIVSTIQAQGIAFDPSMLMGSDMASEFMSESYLKVILFPKDLNNATIEEIERVGNEFPEIKLAGTQLTMYELNLSMISGQKISLLMAFVLVFAFLWMSLRKFIPSFLALIPILVTTLALFGFLGLTGISLNLFTTTLFSITIGVGIDYAIHFTSIYQSYIREGLRSTEAVERAYNFSQRPIIANALGFSVGLSVLMLSPLKVHFYVSALMWVSMILSSLLSLTLLPTLLKKLK